MKNAEKKRRVLFDAGFHFLYRRFLGLPAFVFEHFFCSALAFLTCRWLVSIVRLWLFDHNIHIAAIVQLSFTFDFLLSQTTRVQFYLPQFVRVGTIKRATRKR